MEASYEIDSKESRPHRYGMKDTSGSWKGDNR